MTLKACIEDEIMNFLTIEFTVAQCRKIQCKTIFWLGANKYFKNKCTTDVVHIL